ncbi:Long-chain fatty acid transport protein [Lutibacter oricola]|uniref:Long-chain fatty acid transport protein n=1 Tax=Lutibacter oricola TaxID=762486 RepID=A0A1H3BFP1_9FLAO|nr:outer membrane protein transport protein [Lutibacter oricola]SDX40810.1 Long-chain fatty acid transport protein [Lutibacter oricola]
MKKLILGAMLCIAYISNAQTLDYNDIGVLFSNEKINGTARYNAMSGAFGALGGDLSSIDVNPAGAAVFINSEFAATLSINNSETTSTYYNNNSISENDATNLSQAGGVFVFGGNRNSDWGKTAIGFNYTMANDFEDLWFAQGNSGYPTWTQGPDDTNDVYLDSDGQYFESLTNGKNNKYSFTIATQHRDNLYFGFSLNTYDIEHYQRTLLEENNHDGSGNYLDASLLQELLTYGDGVSVSFGIIAKPNQNLRLGFAYKSPVWYNLSEEYVDYDQELYISSTDQLIKDFSGVNGFDYKLRTPSKTTLSGAYIFDKQGLISVDYTYKNYSNISLSEANFNDQNTAFKQNLESTGELRIGTEWRFDKLSLRGGYHIEQSPYKNAFDSDNLEGFSLGAGIKFRGGKIDVAYQKDNNTAPYNFYPDYNVNSAELDIDNTKVTATLVLNL